MEGFEVVFDALEAIPVRRIELVGEVDEVREQALLFGLKGFELKNERLDLEFVYWASELLNLVDFDLIDHGLVSVEEMLVVVVDGIPEEVVEFPGRLANPLFLHALVGEEGLQEGFDEMVVDLIRVFGRAVAHY